MWRKTEFLMFPLNCLKRDSYNQLVRKGVWPMTCSFAAWSISYPFCIFCAICPPRNAIEKITKSFIYIIRCQQPFMIFSENWHKPNHCKTYTFQHEINFITNNNVIIIIEINRCEFLRVGKVVTCCYETNKYRNFVKEPVRLPHPG